MYSNDELKNIIKEHNPKLAVRVLKIGKKGDLVWNDLRGWQTIIYAEHFSSEEELFSLCNDFQAPCSISPLHDKDLKDEETGELKKAHYHFLAYYKGKTNAYKFYTMLCSIFGEDSFFGVEDILFMNKSIRYHCHLDNPEKAQYDIKKIKDFNGFSSLKYLYNENGDDVMLKRDIKQIIKDNNFLFYSELDDYLEENEFEMFVSLTHNKPLRREIIDYMKSRESMLMYSGGVQKGYTKIKMENGTEKVIFNRQIV